MSGAGSERRFPPFKLVPAFTVVVAGHAESRGAGPRQHRLALRHGSAFALDRIRLAQRGQSQNLCEAAQTSGLYAL